MRLVCCIISLFICDLSIAQKPDFQIGSITDTVPVSGSLLESFALYLPEAYKATDATSIVFIFDPAARGVTGIKPFIAAAEAYNLMLVCSNNSKNGPFEANFEIADRLFDHIFSSFNIAQKGIYIAGFSGGSRLAATIAVRTNAMQGVIGCGAAFSGNNSDFPSFGNTFSYAGLVGDRDMNYREMLRAGQWLNTLNIENEIFIYEDDHNWPPEEQLLRAFDWLRLQAYKKGAEPEDPIKIARIFKDQLNRANAFEKAYSIPEAVAEYERTIRNFSHFYELDSILVKIKELKKSKSYKQALIDLKTLGRLEDTLAYRYDKKFRQEITSGGNKDNFKWWKKQFKKLDENYVGSGRVALKKMGGRLRYHLFALTIESFEGYVRAGEIAKAIYCAQLLEIQGPNNPFFHFRLASGFAKLQQNELVLHHTEAALKNGWEKIDLFEKNREFSSICKEAVFLELLKRFGKNN